jgi:gas vesicle protein
VQGEKKGAMIMKEELTHKKDSILTLVLAGGALGAGFALAMAPKSGSETRKDLKRIADRISQAVDIGTELIGVSREFVGKAVEAGKKAYIEEKPLEPISNGRRSILVPILASGIIGAGIALILTPKLGSAARDNLKRFAWTTRESVVSAMDKGRDLYVAGKGAITEAVGAHEIPYVEGKKDVMHAV